MSKMTAQAQADDVAALLRSRHSLLWIITREEARVEGFLAEAAAAAKYECKAWDCVQGFTDMLGKELRGNVGTDPGAALDFIANQARSGLSRSVWIMRDLTPWLVGPIGMTTVRGVRNLARLLPSVPLTSSQAVIVLTSSADVPPELAGHATVIDWSLPDRAEIASILDAAVSVMPEDMRPRLINPDSREAAIDAAVGLSGEEAQNCFARSLVQQKRIDPLVIAAEKKRVIARERVLEWHDPIPGGLQAVGGLDALKDWLVSRKQAYSPAARAYGLPAPKGAMVVGIPGTGKSLVAKAIATSWGVPLLRLDLGGLKSKFVGESEGNLRKALQVIEAMGRCVVWIDEIEKALAGASDGSADGGVSSDALGTVLSWMQERVGEAFVIATANDVSKLPPELLRKGRFDEIWFVGLPNRTERLQILFAALRSHGRDATALETERLYEVVTATDNFTGSEIAAIVPDAMFAAFADGERAITVGDLLYAASTVVPLARTAADKIRALQDWAVGRARSATTPEVNAPVIARQLEI
jgi:ATPase family associated with various cellular activities (AAA)